MEHKELYPELAEYIFNYCGKYIWQNEVSANSHLMHLGKISSNNTVMYKMLQQRGWISSDSEFLEFAKDGIEIFKKRVTERIFNERFHELELNLCPECGKIARTPWAKQCRFCFDDWH